MESFTTVATLKDDPATVYEMDLTTNRVDAMNHYGVAREASAIYNVELKKVEPKLPVEPQVPPLRPLRGLRSE